MAPICVPQCGALRDPYSAQLLSAMALMQIGSGYNVVAISGAELIWTSEGELYTWTSSVLDAAIFLGFVVGTLSMGRYADLKGRLAAQRVSCLLAAFGAVASALAGPRHGRYVEIACFRFLLGIGAGGAAPIAASYTYERLREVERAAGGPLVHDPRTSGGPASATGSMDIWNLAGQMGSYLVAILLMSCGGWMSKKAMWRAMLGLGALPFLLSAFLTRDAEESRAFARLGDRRLGAGWADFFKALAARDPTGPAKLFDVVLVVFCYQLVCYGLLLLLPDLVEAAIGSPTNREILGVLAALSAVGITAAYSSLGPIDSLGAAAVRAFRCASVLRHLIEGAPDSKVTRLIQDEYDVELRYVFAREDVYARTTVPGDAFFEKHARRHFNWVMREVCPSFGKARKEASRAEALALWRETMLAREAERGEPRGRAGEETSAERAADENEAPANAGSGANADGADAIAPDKAPTDAPPSLELAAA